MVEPRDVRVSRRERAGLVAIAAVLVAVIVAALGLGIASSSSHRPGVAAGASLAAVAGSTEPGPSASRVGGGESVPPATLTGGPPRVGWIAAVDDAGNLSVIAPDGHGIALTDAAATTVGFPAFSPDGGRLAAIVGENGATSVDVFTIDRAGATVPPPVPIYVSSERQAFYVSWMPGGRDVSFLANDADIVALRVAAADRGTPLDGADTESLVRRGAPLYFDWIDDQDALVHVGVGPGAFLGLLRRDGTEDGGALARPGDFRSAQVSKDGRYVAWVRATGDASEVVVASRDGTTEQTLPVSGPAAVMFSPTEDVVAAIGAETGGSADLAFPLGPLRTIDAATGRTAVLLDGLVVASFWSPDGRTVAALRLQASGGSTALAPGALAAAVPSAPPNEVHLLFVDVASGAVRSDRVVQPGGRLVSEVLPYFDQYELSHRPWAPDSSSFLLPIVTDAGTSEVVALPPDGGEPTFSIRAGAAFWSP
ncbi:MAG TPA: hypothetical protein VFJ71_05105 [Candidatus Limnocylindrales bacterium]|nr:hypothetical protein [Candidatus Limnocylindrales bacterium]